MATRHAPFLLVAFLATSSTLLVVQAFRYREPLDALATLTHLHQPGVDLRDVTMWPPQAMSTLRISLGHKESSAVAVRLSGKIALLRGDCTGAARRFESGLRDVPRDPNLLRDAAMAHACVAQQTGDGREIVRAIERAATVEDQITREPPAATTAALNVLGITNLSLIPTDPTTLRTDEWKQPLATPVVEQYARDHPQAVREFVEHILLAEWGEQIAGNENTSALERNLQRVGTARLTAFGDAFLSDVSWTIETARGGARDELAHAHTAYARGLARYDAGHRESAGDDFARAASLFRRAGSPFEEEARLELAIVQYQQRNLDAAATEIEEVLVDAQRNRYLALAARARWIAALVAMQRGSMDEAVAWHRASLAAYEQLSEIDNVAAVANSAADTLRVAGDTARGWPLLVRAARTLPRLPNLQRRYLILFNLSLYAQTEGALRAALLFQDAAVGTAHARAQPLTIIESHLRRAELSVERRAINDALANIKIASTLLPRVDSAASVAYLRAWRDRTAAEIEGFAQPEAAATQFDRLTHEFDIVEPAEVPALFLEAGRASKRAGFPDRAEAELTAGIDLVFARRARLKSPEFRLAYLSAWWDLFHELLDLRFARSPASALETAEAGRLALTAPNAVPRTGLPTPSSDGVILYYSVLSDRLLLWTIAPSGMQSTLIPYRADDLAADVDAYRDALISGKHDVAEAMGHRLAAVLLPAGAIMAGPVRRLSIAADGIVVAVPFAMLPDRQDGRPLLEHYEITYVTPAGADRFRPQPIRPARAIVALGYDGTGENGLQPLEAAEREATLVASLYSRGMVLTGTDAKAENLRRTASGAEILHLAAHARANLLAPWASELDLAPTGGTPSSGALTFAEVERWNLRGCRLVVLSACETATGSRARGLGVVSLATPFLDAGVSAVIGTLWPVEDRASLLFMQKLHAQVAHGLDPAAALRVAQIDALHSADPALANPTVWAAYVITVAESRSVPR